jgi:hypothetical protein
VLPGLKKKLFVTNTIELAPGGGLLSNNTAEDYTQKMV